MKKAETVTTTYEVGIEDFLIDITVSNEGREAWIYRRSYGVKNLMFGVDEDQETEESFLKLVWLNIPYHVDIYNNEEIDNDPDT